MAIIFFFFLYCSTFRLYMISINAINVALFESCYRIQNTFQQDQGEKT